MFNRFLNISFLPPERLINFFLIVMTLMVYWQVQHHAFVNFDDNQYISENPHIQAGLTSESIKWALSADLVFDSPYADLWIPVTYLSHLVSFELFGMDPSRFHLVNLAFHILNTLLLFGVLRRMTGALWQSAFVAMLFAIHPLHVESVAWITERKDVLSTFFWFLTMWAYLQYTKDPTLHRYLLVVLAFAVGLMAKPMLITLPFVLLLLDYWPLNRLPLENHRIIWKRVWEKIPLLVLMVVFMVITFLAQKKGGFIFGPETLFLGIRVENALVSYMSYIVKMFWPTNLAVFYPHPGNALPLWKVLGSSLLLVCITILTIRLTPKYPYLGVGWLWYLGTLVPVIGLVQVGVQAMADRYTYVPLIGLFMMMAWGVPELVSRWRRKRVFLSISAGLVALALMVTTWLQVGYWRSSLSLFEHATEVTANNYIAHNNLGNAYRGKGRLDAAIQEYQKALVIMPNFVEARTNIGNAYRGTKRFDKAIQELQRVLVLKPSYAIAHSSLGIVYGEMGQLDEAIRELEIALKIDPGLFVARQSLEIANRLKKERKKVD